MNDFYLGIDKSVDERLTVIERDLNKNTQHYKDLLFELVEITDDIQKNKMICEYHIKKLKEGMLQSWDYVYYWNSGCYVNIMSNDFEECKELLLDLWHSKNAAIRQRLISILDYNTSVDVIEQVIKESRTDRSKWVRSAISGHIFRYNLKQYSEELESRISEEKDETVKESLDKAINFLKNGYVLEDWDNDMVRITYLCKNGQEGIVVNKDELTKFTEKNIVKGIYEGSLFFGLDENGNLEIRELKDKV